MNNQYTLVADALQLTTQHLHGTSTAAWDQKDSRYNVDDLSQQHKQSLGSSLPRLLNRTYAGTRAYNHPGRLQKYCLKFPSA